MAETSVLLLFFMAAVSLLSAIVLGAAAKVLNGWMRVAAIVLAIASGMSFLGQCVVILAVFALRGFT